MCLDLINLNVNLNSHLLLVSAYATVRCNSTNSHELNYVSNQITLRRLVTRTQPMSQYSIKFEISKRKTIRLQISWLNVFFSFNFDFLFCLPGFSVFFFQVLRRNKNLALFKCKNLMGCIIASVISWGTDVDREKKECTGHPETGSQVAQQTCKYLQTVPGRPRCSFISLGRLSGSVWFLCLGNITNQLCLSFMAIHVLISCIFRLQLSF